MRDWTYHDPDWRDRVGDSVDATVREALRRAIDIRDGVSAGIRVGRCCWWTFSTI